MERVGDRRYTATTVRTIRILPVTEGRRHIPAALANPNVQRETTLVGSIAILLLVMLATPLAVPGIIEDLDDGDDFRQSSLSLHTEDSTIRVLSVPGRTVTLQLDTRLVHRGGPSENVTLEVRAIDSESGLLIDQQRQSVGTIEGERTASVLTNLSVEREGGYRIETIVYEDGDRRDGGVREISNAQALTPDYADSSVQFERYENSEAEIPTIAVDPASVQNNRSQLSVSAALTNGGNIEAGDVTVRLRARQVDSNVVAAQTERDVRSIRPGRTVEANTTMTVPDNYNYYIDAILLKDGVIIDTSIGVANLDPTRPVEPNETREDVDFDTGDFEDGPQTERMEDDGPARREETTIQGSGPGFGVALSLVALLAIALLTARRQTND